MNPFERRAPRPSATAEILLWQVRLRLVAALLIGAAGVLLLSTGALRGSRTQLFEATIGYIAAAGLIALFVRETGRANCVVIGATVVADLLLVFSATVLSSTPAEYARVLMLTFLVLHLAVAAFGQVVALGALTLAAAGFVLLLAHAARAGMAVPWSSEGWTLGLFLLTGGSFIQVYGGMSARLRRLVELFERAEEGDFAEPFDVGADPRPDAVTAVGEAYNRVREHLASMVLTDPLTACLNRRGFDQSLARELARATRAGSEVSLLALDLDHFKNVNDTRGHLVGDTVLRETGELLLRTVRTGDLVARTGGEEFTILLPDTGSSGAYQLATRLCDTFRGHPFVVSGGAVRLTVSVGAVASEGRNSDRLGEELKNRADQALYAAKRTGRDRVRVWTPSMGVSAQSERKSGAWLVTEN